jgi:hypothetical protein
MKIIFPIALLITALSSAYAEASVFDYKLENVTFSNIGSQYQATYTVSGAFQYDTVTHIINNATFYTNIIDPTNNTQNVNFIQNDTTRSYVSYTYWPDSTIFLSNITSTLSSSIGLIFDGSLDTGGILWLHQATPGDNGNYDSLIVISNAVGQQSNYYFGTGGNVISSNAPIPLPSAFIMFTSGLLGLGALRRKKNPANVHQNTHYTKIANF